MDKYSFSLQFLYQTVSPLSQFSGNHFSDAALQRREAALR